MSKRDIRRWAYRQYQGDIHPWPLWLRGFGDSGAGGRLEAAGRAVVTLA